MRINWFSPLPPERTEIANHTMRILPYLQKHAEVILWTSQEKWETSVDKQAEVVRFDAKHIPWQKFNAADLTLYNIGNNPKFHQEIWNVSRINPGIVILHDLYLHHFFSGIYKYLIGDKAAYLKMMDRYYGGTCRGDAEDFWIGSIDPNAMSKKYPLMSFALENARGFILHNNDTSVIEQEKINLPHLAIELPYPVDEKQRKLAADVGRKNDVGPFRLIVFGFIGSNRRIESILTALSTFSQNDKFRLDIYGEIPDVRQLKRMVERLHLDKIVAIHQYVSESELDVALSGAHLAFNLRYPSMGEASASQLKIWSYALPAIVTRTGWYAGIPENVVRFADIENEIATIREHLEAFLDDPNRFTEIGKNGFEYLLKNHSPEDYAENIILFSKDVYMHHADPMLFDFSDMVGELVANIANKNVPGDFLKSVSSKILPMFKNK